MSLVSYIRYKVIEEEEYRQNPLRESGSPAVRPLKQKSLEGSF